MLVQTKVPKVNRTKHDFNKSVAEKKNHNDLKVKQIKKISEEKPKIPKTSQNDIKTVSNTSQNLNPKIEHRLKPQNQLEENKITSKPTQITNKKITAPKYSELIELAKKNLERKDGSTKTNPIKTPPIPAPGRNTQPITPQKRKLTEDKAIVPTSSSSTITTTTPKKQIKTSNKQTTSTQDSPKNTVKTGKCRPNFGNIGVRGVVFSHDYKHTNNNCTYRLKQHQSTLNHETVSTSKIRG